MRTIADISRGIARSKIRGLEMAYNSNTLLDVAAGAGMDSSYQYVLEIPNTTKDVSVAFSPGGAGGRSATMTTNTGDACHVFVIGDSQGLNPTDVLFDNSIPPTLPTGYDVYRWIGMIPFSGPTQLKNFVQYGDWVYMNGAIEAFNGSAPTTLALMNILPAGKELLTEVSAYLRDNTVNPISLFVNTPGLQHELSQNSVNTQVIGTSITKNLFVRTNAQGQIEVRASATTNNTVLTILKYKLQREE